MAKKYCPRCNARFVCKSGDIDKCQCMSAHLDEETRRFMEKTFSDCLCSS
ncbi:MAG: cysteine-rich CWC family protein [Williamsia sp.]|nr:cysteine-rich CWC family protein [Williamsia sp.]